MEASLQAKSSSSIGMAVKLLTASALLISPAINHAKSKTVQLAIEDIQDTENCGIEERLVSEALVDLAESNGIRLKRSKADFVLFADVNVLGIPNSLGVWTKSCSFNINIEFQRHQEIEIKGIGKVLSSAKLCDSGYMGYISDGNLQFFTEALQNSFVACMASLPKKVRKAVAT